ncbi:MAG TPA: hypothetical protein DDW30_00925 [Clostridiales bacterium]|nr:hypothetical protein [Clostridiales bacterium]
MEKKRKKKGLLSLLCLLLPLAMMVTAIGCGKKGDNSSTSDNGTTTNGNGSATEEETTSKYDIPDTVGNKDYGDAVIRIASTNRSWYDDEVVVARATGDIVDDAVYRRNKLVEQRLGVRLVNNPMGSGGAPQYAVPAQIRQDKNGGMDSIDIAWNPVYSTIMYTDEGLLANLLELPNLNLQAGYWSRLFNETASIGNAQYMATGPISLSYYRYVFVTYVNKTLLNSVDNAPDLVEVVNSGKWTLDYQYELAKGYYRDMDGVPHNEQDVYGFISSPYLNVDPYWSSCEIEILKKDENNFYEYNLTDATTKEKLVRTVDKILKLYYDEDATYLFKPDFADESGNGEQNRIAEKFGAGTAVMATLRLLHVEDECVRNLKDKYMILPIAKLDESQTTYYSYQHDSYTGVAIPSTVPTARYEMLGAVLEVLASESYHEVTPAYYETALKVRYMDDQASWKMLDLITNNIKMDAGALYTKVLTMNANGLGVTQALRGIINANKGNTVATTYNESIAETIRTKLTTMQDSIKKLQGLT